MQNKTFWAPRAVATAGSLVDKLLDFPHVSHETICTIARRRFLASKLSVRHVWRMAQAMGRGL